MKSQHSEPNPNQGQPEGDGPRRTALAEESLRRIGTALQGLRYGSVLATVQDGVVVQIDRTEKTRLGRA